MLIPLYHNIRNIAKNLFAYLEQWNTIITVHIFSFYW